MRGMHFLPSDRSYKSRHLPSPDLSGTRGKLESTIRSGDTNFEASHQGPGQQRLLEESSLSLSLGLCFEGQITVCPALLREKEVTVVRPMAPICVVSFLYVLSTCIVLEG